MTTTFRLVFSHGSDQSQRHCPINVYHDPPFWEVASETAQISGINFCFQGGGHVGTRTRLRKRWTLTYRSGPNGRPRHERSKGVLRQQQLFCLQQRKKREKKRESATWILFSSFSWNNRRRHLLGRRFKVMTIIRNTQDIDTPNQPVSSFSNL